MASRYHEVYEGWKRDPEGFWAEAAAEIESSFTIGRVLHPSPASPAANRDWAGTATRQLQELGIW